MSQDLVVFDIDGTLTHTNAVDEECFQKILSQYFKIGKLSTNWADYKYCTDSGIIDEVFLRELKLKPSPEDLSHYKEFIVKAFKETHQKNPSAFQEIPGAKQMIEHLISQTEWRVAVATGAFQPSALFKLSAAGISLEGIPAAFAEDAFERKEILKTAVKRAEEFFDSKFSHVVYVGDGTWDFKAAKECGYGFIGIGSQKKGELLRAIGAKTVFFDYRDQQKFLKALQEAKSI